MKKKFEKQAAPKKIGRPKKNAPKKVAQKTASKGK
jgi:hypothetical protein